MKINLCEAKYEVTDGERTIYIVNREGVWSIVTNREDEEFIFCNYSNDEKLENAKAIIKLLQKAIKFIEKNIKEEK